jgi:hypothetical protein
LKKPQVDFTFRCSYKPETVLELLREQVNLVKDREYLLHETEEGFELGIGRGGHGAGYWYCARIREDGAGSQISGRVLHRHYSGRVSEDREMNLWDHLAIYLLTIIFLPIVIGPWIKQKIHPKPTMEEQFVEFMTEKLDCELLK